MLTSYSAGVPSINDKPEPPRPSSSSKSPAPTQPLCYPAPRAGAQVATPTVVPVATPTLVPDAILTPPVWLARFFQVLGFDAALCFRLLRIYVNVSWIRMPILFALAAELHALTQNLNCFCPSRTKPHHVLTKTYYQP